LELESDEMSKVDERTDIVERGSKLVYPVV